MTDADVRLRVLVVEDEPVNRALLRAVIATSTNLRLKSAELREAETLAEGRTLVAQWHPDLIVLDVRLPDGNGLELARELPPPDAPDRPQVLVMSASVLPVDLDAARQSGGDAFLGKPYRPAELIVAIERLLGPRDATRNA